jgi:glycosyltransferase involved in cell wall biosynthesis
MHICAVSTAQIPSNTANSIQVMKVCQAMAQNGHSVRLLVPGLAAAAWEDLAPLYGLSNPFAIEWIASDPRWRRNDFALMASRLARGADLVYTWTVQSAVAALIGAQPALLEVHDLPSGRLGPLWLRMFLRQPGKKRLVLITAALRRALEARLKRALPPGQLVIAPNGVEPERYHALPPAAQARALLGLPEKITVGCTGHLYEGRGADLFMSLAARFPQASFVWVGGREADVTRQRARALQAGLSNVTFSGFVPQAAVPLTQAAADILLMPYGRSIAGSSGGNSAEICSPMKLFDYLAAQRAILSSDLPVIREILDENSAVFAAPEDLEAWSAALARLLAEPDLRASLSARSAEKALQYSWRNRQERCLSRLF